MKAKKIKTKHNSEKDVRAIVSFFILALAFGILLLFNSYKDDIIANGMFQLFMVMVVFGMALLFSLMYLVNKK